MTTTTAAQFLADVFRAVRPARVPAGTHVTGRADFLGHRLQGDQVASSPARRAA